MKLIQIVERFGGAADGDPAVEVTGVTGIEFAGPTDATFAVDEATLGKAEASPACCVIVAEGARSSAKPLIRCESPNGYAADLLEFFHPQPAPEPGVHPTAVIAETADVSDRASIGPQVIIGDRCRIAADVQLLGGVCLGASCEIGEAMVIHPNVTVYADTCIGARVLIHAGVVIGADGFGFFRDGGRLRKWPHVGNVVIEDDVEVGANACIDRAKFGTTLIERGAKIDNLVQVAHNCRLGAGSIVAGQTALAGGAVLEEGVTCGGQAGIGNHVTVGRGSSIAGQTMVISDVPAGAVCFGTPSRPFRQAMRETALLGFLAANARVVRKLVRDAAQG